MEELLDQKKMHETSLSQRGNILSVLLHQTTSSSNNSVDQINKTDIKLEPTSTITSTTNTTTTAMDVVDIKKEPQLSVVS